MIQGSPTKGTDETFLQAELERLVEAERARGPVAAVVRLRALADISSRLSTDVLVALSAAVSTIEITSFALDQAPARRTH